MPRGRMGGGHKEVPWSQHNSGVTAPGLPELARFAICHTLTKDPRSGHAACEQNRKKVEQRQKQRYVLISML